MQRSISYATTQRQVPTATAVDFEEYDRGFTEAVTGQPCLPQYARSDWYVTGYNRGLMSIGQYTGN